jgi:hypothetical protein
MIIYLNGLLFNDPSDWSSITTSIRRDDDTDALLVFQDFPLTYFGAAYDYFVQLKTDYNFCYSLPIEIFNTDQSGEVLSQLCKGNIFLSDCEFYETEKKVVVKVVDNSFYAMINNNKSINTSMSATQSKNAIDIDPATPFALACYGSNNALYKTCYAVTVHDAFKHLIDFMSDGKLDFVSDTFAYGGDWGHLLITSGDKLSGSDPSIYNQPPIPPFNFADLYKEIKRRIPIGMTVEDPYGSQRIRIESLDYFFKSNSAVVFENIDKIRTRFDTSKLYSKVKFGTSTTSSNAGLYFPENISFLGFKDEEFHVTGTCNIDKALDLSCDWITSANVIDDCIRNGSQDYDGELVLIESVQSSAYAGRTRNTNYLNLDPSFDVHVYFVNENLTNNNIAKRYKGSIPNDLASYFGVKGAGLFQAIQNPNSVVYVQTGPDVISPYIYGATVFNNGGYFNGSGRYTTPFSGVFDFNVNFRITVSQLYGTGIVYWYIRLLQYDSTGALVAAYYPLINYNVIVGSNKYFSFGQLGTFNLIGKERIILNAGDYLEVEFNKSPYAGDVDYQFLKDFTNWSCTANTIGGGVVADYSTDDYAIEQHIFNMPLTKEDFNLIVQDPAMSYKFFSMPENIRTAWIKSITYNHQTQIMQATLFTNRTQNAN